MTKPAALKKPGSIKTPAPAPRNEALKQTLQKTTVKAQPHTSIHKHDTPRHSLSARVTCKERPDKLERRKPGGGTSREFVPWCDRKRK